MRVPREKKMKSKKVRKFLPAIRCVKKIKKEGEGLGLITLLC